MIPETCSSDGVRAAPKLTENAQKVLRARYLKKDEAGECMEAPADLFDRVAANIADVEVLYGATDVERRQWQDRYYRLMASGDFMPNSPTLMNAGREMGMLSACFVLPVRDSIVDIFDSIKHTALIQKAGGGTGFAFDELRPTGDFIASSGGTTSGPITFWRAFSEATNAIQQGAFRRGANMGMMYIHHPDILKFLHAKQDLSQFTNYNISVKVTDDWMDEYLADPDSPHIVRNPRNGKAFAIPRSYKIWESDIRALIEVDCVRPVSPASGERYHRSPRMTGPLPAELRGMVYTKREIWKIIVDNAWQTGEPGVVFIDRINEHNPTPHVGRIEATNPCGEQPLLPYEACNLGSVNLGAFILNACTPQADVDWERLKTAVHVSTRFLDNVIDANNYPLDEIDHICKANRKIGLGVMGFADALYRLNVAYNSEEGVAWGERLMKFVNDEAHAYSEHLARTRGCFPNWKGSLWHARNRMMRNSAVTTVAPTGTISIIANCSGGIEPMFSLAFVRNVLKGQKEGARPLVEVNETFESVARQRGIHSPALMERLAAEGTLAHIDGIPDDLRRVFVCAHDVAPEWHMRMQAAFQRHCDSSISKTINFPQSASRDDVERIYRLAYDLRCKGVTVYRDGCRECQPMALTGKDDASAGKQGEAGVAAPTSQAAPERGNGDASAGRPTPAAPRANGHEPHGAAARSGASDAPLAPSSASRLAGLVPGAGSSNSRGPGPGGRAVRQDVAVPTAASAPAPVIPPPFAIEAGAPAFEPRDLPEIASGLRIRQMTPFGNMHVKITVDPRTQRELEVFAQLGKGGDVANSDLEGICRTASLWLRAGGSLRHLIKQWDGIGSSLQIPTKVGRIMSLPDGLACALKKYLRAKERFGLRALLLGEIDLAELDRPGNAVLDRAAYVGHEHATDGSGHGAGANGNGGDAGGNRNGGNHGNGNGANGRAAAGTGREAVAAPGSNPPHGDGARVAGAAVDSHAFVGRPSADTRAGRASAATLGGQSPGAVSLGPEPGAAAAAQALPWSAGGGAGVPRASSLSLDDRRTPDADAAGFSTLTEGGVAAVAVATPERIAERLRSVDVEAEIAPADVESRCTQSRDTPGGAPSDIGDAAEPFFDLSSPDGEPVCAGAAGIDEVDSPAASRLIADHDPASGYKLICPECHSKISRQEGCQKCHGCGWAAC